MDHHFKFLCRADAFVCFSGYPTLCARAAPYQVRLISGLFFGFAFGVAGIASAVLGNMADKFGIESVYNVCAYMPLLGLVTFFCPI